MNKNKASESDSNEFTLMFYFYGSEDQATYASLQDALDMAFLHIHGADEWPIRIQRGDTALWEWSDATNTRSSLIKFANERGLTVAPSA